MSADIMASHITNVVAYGKKDNLCTLFDSDIFLVSMSMVNIYTVGTE